MREKLILFLMFLFFLSAASLFAAESESPPTQIKADEISYDKEDVVAQGHVVLTHGETEIDTDILYFHPKTGLLESEGPIILKEEGEKIIGRHLQYNVNTKQGSFSEVSGSSRNIYAQGAQIRGELFFKADYITINGNVLEFKGVDSSTCDFLWGTKHYHIDAENIKVIPGDKMIILHGHLWVGKTRLWHVAKLVIDLHPRPKHRQSYTPHFGYNKVDGFFVKTATNFQAYRDNYGTLLADLYQKTGVATGIEDQFELGSRGSSHVSFYHQNGSGLQNFTREQVTTNSQYNFGNGLTASGSANLFRYRVPPISSPDTYSTQFAVNKQGGRYSWSLTESNNVTSGFNNSQTWQFHDLHDFGNNFHVDLSESYFKSTVGSATNSTFHNLTGFSKQFNGWGADLFIEKTSAGLFQGGFIDRTPELALHTDVMKLKKLDIPYQLSMSFGNYFESFKSLQASRWDFQFNLPQNQVELSKNVHFTSSALYRQDFYDTGTFYPTQRMSARYILGGVGQLSTSLGNHFDAVLDYRSQSNIGFDPLVYDIVTPYRTLAGEVAIHNKDSWRLDIGTAYDYKNNFYQQLVTRLDLRPIKDWSFHFDGNYDPNSKQWQNLISVADIRPFRDIRVQYWSSFSLLNGQVGYQDIALYKDWHDWEARLIYRWRQQEVYLFFNLKAFPEQQVQLGINPLLNVDPTSAQFEFNK